MAEHLSRNETRYDPQRIVTRIIGILGTKLNATLPHTPSHFADEYTKSHFTKQGVIVVERVLPKVGVNLHIKATPLGDRTP